MQSPSKFRSSAFGAHGKKSPFKSTPIGRTLSRDDLFSQSSQTAMKKPAPGDPKATTSDLRRASGDSSSSVGYVIHVKERPAPARHAEVSRAGGFPSQKRPSTSSIKPSGSLHGGSSYRPSPKGIASPHLARVSNNESSIRTWLTSKPKSSTAVVKPKPKSHKEGPDLYRPNSQIREAASNDRPIRARPEPGKYTIPALETPMDQ